MLDNDSSVRLNLVRFPLIVGVVFIHANVATVLLANKLDHLWKTMFTN